MSLVPQRTMLVLSHFFFPVAPLVSAKAAEINTILRCPILGVELQGQGFLVWVKLTCNFHLLHTNPQSVELHHLCEVVNSFSSSALANIY